MNTTTITLGGKEITLRASNWASQLYAEQFYGQERGPYVGNLQRDTAQVFADCCSVDGEGGIQVSQPPFQLWGIVWALAAAAGSTKAGYDQWMKSKRNEVWPVSEQIDAASEVIDLVEKAFFR